MPTRLFVEVSVGSLFHFIKGQERDGATYVKIDASKARAQAGGEVVEAAPDTMVCVVGL